MKLGCSWNVFDGEELLEGSIRQIRESVDFISVVYQTVSNYGNPCNPTLKQMLNQLKEMHLIDHLYEYEPRQHINAQMNEITKRNIGLHLSKENGCTHHMSLDSDEYYVELEFKKLKEMMIEGEYDSSFAQMRTYYKTPEYRLIPPENYYVSLIYRIYPDSAYKLSCKAPVEVDPTRKMSPAGKFYIIPRQNLEMHHMCFVRRNLRGKLSNSSAKVFFSEKKIDTIVSHYENWVYPNKVMWVKGNLLQVEKVNNFFNIKI